MTSRRHFIILSGLSMAATALPLRRPLMDVKPVILLRSSWNDKNIVHTPGTLRLLERYVPEALVSKKSLKVRLIFGEFAPDKADSPVTKAFNEAMLVVAERQKASMQRT